MKTGPFTFTDGAGDSWRIVGTSTVCTDSYADIERERDGALSVRPKGVLRAAGLEIPEPEEALDPKFGGTIAEEHERYGCLICGGADCTPTCCITDDHETAPSLEVPEQEAEGTPQATGAVGADTFKTGRFALVRVVGDEEAYCTSWDEWAEAEAAAWPLEEGYAFIDTVAGTRLDAGSDAWTYDSHGSYSD